MAEYFFADLRMRHGNSHLEQDISKELKTTEDFSQTYFAVAAHLVSVIEILLLG